MTAPSARAAALAESIANGVAGLAVSVALVETLRAAGLWNASPLVVSALFFMASVARSYALRRAFRAWEGRRWC